MKKFTIKSLLIAAALCFGTSAWAEEVTATLVHTASTSCGADKAVVKGTVDVEKEHYNNEGSGTWQGYAFAEFEFDIPENQVVVSAQLTWTGTTTSKARNHALYYLNVGNELNYDAISNSPSLLRYNGNKTYIVTESFGNEATKVTDVTSAINDVYNNNSNKIIFQWTGNQGGGDLYGKASDKAPKLVITTANATATTSYTIKYWDESDNLLNSVTVEDAAIGSRVTASNEELASFFNGDKTKKYIYKSGNEEITLVKDAANNVINLVFREAEKYNYTVNAVNAVGEKLKELVTGSNFEGEKSRAYVTKGLNINGDWYITSGNGSYPTYGYDFTEAATKDVTYTVNENVDYFFEVEDINKSRDWAATGAYPERYSNGKAGRLYKGAYAFTDALAGGVYTITLWARNNSGSAVANVGLYYRDTNGNATPLGVNFADWDKGQSVAKTLENVIIPDGASLMLKNENPDYNSNLEMDYLIFTKTGEATTITDAGYATFSSTYAVDFSESGLEAYTAKVNDGNQTITLTKINDGIVPANTGVILKGAEGNYTGVITTTDATVDNDLKANATKIIGGDGSIYVLNNGTKGIGFYQLSETGTLAAGKAYLKITSNAKAYTFVWNESTGIEENYEFGTMNSDAATYDLSGRKVTNPAKGLYIKNGKKFIVK